MTEQTDPCTVLIYSDDPKVRAHIRTAIGRHPSPDLDVTFVEAGTYAEVISLVDPADIDLVVLDGEAAPGGGIGLARQLKDEIEYCPPTLVVIARAADRWLAAYAKVDATLVHPLDPILTARTVVQLLTQPADQVPADQLPAAS